MHILIVYYVIKAVNVFLTCMHLRQKCLANFLKLTVNSIKKGDIIFEWAELRQEELVTLISYILVNNHIERNKNKRIEQYFIRYTVSHKRHTSVGIYFYT